MTPDEMHVGRRVRTLSGWRGVRPGDEGIIDKVETFKGRPLWFVAWDTTDNPLPPGYARHNRQAARRARLLRDGFGPLDLRYLEPVRPIKDHRRQ